MSFMDWVGTIGAIWLAVSILLAVAWALGGRRIFRKPPMPNVCVSEQTVADIVHEMRRRNGGA